MFAPLDREHQRLGNPIIFALGRRFIFGKALSFLARVWTLRGRNRLVIFTSPCTLFFSFSFFFTTTIRITAGAAGAMPWEWRAGDTLWIGDVGPQRRKLSRAELGGDRKQVVVGIVCVKMSGVGNGNTSNAVLGVACR